MRYVSTRDPNQIVSFEDAVLIGLSPEGGLFVPENIPQLDWQTIISWADLSLAEIAFKIFRLYIDQHEIPDKELLDLLEKSFSKFTHPKKIPLCKLPMLTPNVRLWVLELFHGPTFAFKDVALQILGNLFEFFLQRKRRLYPNEHHQLNIVGATSGDTGGAAIYGLKGKQGIKVFILHPKGRISSVQELQMTTVLDSNVHNIAVEGTFDDCQEIVKLLLSDAEFKAQYHLGAINSINWARILSQMSYYFYAFLDLLKAENKLNVESMDIEFSVPTGNFGDILAGYYAKQMGLPIHKLIIATNENDILYRFLSSGVYEKRLAGPSVFEPAKQTLSPAMDILVSSNFERLLYHLMLFKTANDREKASQFIQEKMNQLKATGGFSVDPFILTMAKSIFAAYRASDVETSDAIQRYYTTGMDASYILDPHTAVGVVAAEKHLKLTQSKNMIVLATASPGKFPDAVLSAINQGSNTILSFKEFAPLALYELHGKPKRCTFVSSPSIEQLLNDVKTIIHAVNDTFK